MATPNTTVPSPLVSNDTVSPEPDPSVEVSGSVPSGSEVIASVVIGSVDSVAAAAVVDAALPAVVPGAAPPSSSSLPQAAATSPSTAAAAANRAARRLDVVPWLFTVSSPVRTGGCLAWLA